MREQARERPPAYASDVRHLAQQQRVPARRRSCGACIEVLAEHRQQRGHRGVVEPLQGDDLGRGQAGQLAEERLELVVEVRSGVTCRGNQEERRVARRPRAT